MKKFFVFLFLISNLHILAQEKDIAALSLALHFCKSMDLKNGYNVAGSLNVNLAKQFYIAVGYHQLKYTSAQKPDDFYGGFFTAVDVDDRYKVITLGIGKTLKTPIKRLNIATELGISNIGFQEKVFTAKQVTVDSTYTSNHSSELIGWFSSSPSHVVRNSFRNRLGCDIKAKVELVLTPALSTSLGYWQNFNTYKNIRMVELTFAYKISNK